MKSVRAHVAPCLASSAAPPHLGRRATAGDAPAELRPRRQPAPKLSSTLNTREADVVALEQAGLGQSITGHVAVEIR
jgi:hypothetical protein